MNKASAAFARDYLRQTQGGEPDEQERRGYQKYAQPGAEVIAEFVYRLPNGEPYLMVEKTEPKGFRMKHWDGQDWQNKKPSGPKIPYRLPDLLAAPADQPVWACEGEKDADNVAKLGLVATSASEGAGNWSQDLVPWFAGRKQVFVLADNDELGRKHAEQVAASLAPVVGDVRIVYFDDLPEAEDVSYWIDKRGGDRAKLLERAAAAPAFAGRPLAEATPFVAPAPADIPRREWLYHPHYIRGYLSLSLAPGGMGKSALAIAEALAMASGKPLLGVTPQSPLRVLYWNLEDPMDELARRTVAAMNHHKITQDDISDRLFLNSGRTTPLLLASERGWETVINEPLITALIAMLQDRQIDVMVVDPFVAAHRVSENDNTKVDQVARALALVAETAGVAIMLIHHTRKLGPTPGTVDDGRGASSLLAASRSARLLSGMTKPEAEGAGVEERERRFYFRSDHGKASMTPPAEHADWYRIQSVSLGNASRDLDDGDSVGVVEAWRYPNTERLNSSPTQLRAFLTIVEEQGPLREDQRAKMWVGAALADVLGLGPVRTMTRATKKQVARRVLELIEGGILMRVALKDEDGDVRPYVKVGPNTSDIPLGAADDGG